MEIFTLGKDLEREKISKGKREQRILQIVGIL